MVTRMRAMRMPWRGLALGLGLLLGPAAIEWAVWSHGVVPARQRRLRNKQTQALVSLKPAYDAALRDSREQAQRLEAAQGGALSSADPVTIVQQLGRRHRIEIAQVRLRQQETSSPSPATQPSSAPVPRILDVEAVGPFHRLAHWLSDLEAQTGLQVDAAELGTAEGGHGRRRLGLQLEIVAGSPERS